MAALQDSAPSRRLPRGVVIMLVAVLGIAFIAATREQPGAAVATVEPQPAAPGQPAPEVGSPAPGFSLQSIDGQQVALEDLRGQVVLVNLWASWCPPCRAEMPAIQAAYEQYAHQGFTVLAVNQGEAGEVAAAFLRNRNLTFPALLDRYGEVSNAYQVTAMPSSFFVDRKGIVRMIYKGPMSHSVIEGTVEQLLAER